jgi:hypothetical protein
LFAGQGLQGTQGTQGLQGVSGLIGAQGVQGLQGQQGTQGSQGVQGLDGASGNVGAQGTQGRQGTQGLQGTSGNIGLQGVQGNRGLQGVQGIQGVQGLQGLDGLFAGQGAQGLRGLQGTQGLQGLEGALGQSGSQGSQGVQATQGAQGVQGKSIQGIQGTIAAQGYQGVQGLSNQGVQGSLGLQGFSGGTGVDGTQGTQGTAGSVAGNNQELLYNNNGSVGGASGLTWDGTNLSFSVLQNRYAGSNSSLSNNNYAIYQESGSWSTPFPDLRIHNLTGIGFGANRSYGGYRFYDEPINTTTIMTINGNDSGAINESHVKFRIADDGIDASTNSFVLKPNNSTTYSPVQIGGNRGSYGGFNDAYSGVNMMWDSSGNGGAYRQANSKWHYFWNVSNDCLAINASTTNSSYSLYVTGNIYASGTITAASDARLKTNVNTIVNPLDKVNLLRGVNFEWKDIDESKGRYGGSQMGFIAQEVDEHVPELVMHNEDLWSVSYGNATALLVEAVKELSDRVSDLEDKLNS